MSCKPDPALSKADAATAIAAVLAELRRALSLDLDPAGYVNGIAMVNTLAWAIDAARNLLPTSPAVSTVQGLHDADRWGSLPQHVVALTEAEIEQLHDNHVYAASRTKKPRKGDWAPDFKASHEYHAARATIFEPLLPKDQDEAVDQEPPL